MWVSGRVPAPRSFAPPTPPPPKNPTARHPDIESEVATLLLDAETAPGAKSLRLLAKKEHLPALLVGSLLGVVTGWPAGVM